MTGLSVLFGEANSLRRGLVVNILLAVGFCFALASVILTYEFYEHLANNRNGALAREAAEIAGQISPAAPELGLDAGALRFQGDAGLYRYTVFDGAMRPVIGGEVVDGLADRVPDAATGKPRFLTLGDTRTAAALTVERDGRRFVVLVSTAARRSGKSDLAKLTHEITEEIHWLAIGIAAILFAAILATRRSLAPLRRVSGEAGAIGPGTTDRRLSTAHLPAEIVPLVTAVNEAFDRLDRGYRAQRDFSSNVAHEVRTPLAILRSAIDQMDDGPFKHDLRNDVHRLEQMFEQLVNLARAEALGVTAFEEVDLHTVALCVAQEMGVAAMRDGKKLAVTGAAGARVQGHAGLLAIALGNLLRNAITYADGTGEIEIEISDNPAGWHVLDRGPGIPDAQKAQLFQRFTRGETGGRQGAGIGLAIVKSVAEAHGATVSVADRPGGGSVFSFLFRTP
ncbi:MAG: sensor histidine kinase [Roseovarius sp.]|uniref:sensor histidine kinase n=1 Tax=Roseovarius sp. TaxID=1486281 RepID=UPI004059B3CC